MDFYELRQSEAEGLQMTDVEAVSTATNLNEERRIATGVSDPVLRQKSPSECDAQGCIDFAWREGGSEISVLYGRDDAPDCVAVLHAQSIALTPTDCREFHG